MARRKDNVSHDDLEGYDSNFEDDDEESHQSKRKRKGLTEKDPAPIIVPSGSTKVLPSKEYFQTELTRAEAHRNRYYALNAYERHRKLINDYFLYHPGAAEKVLRRDDSKDKRDIDIIKDNHKFLWDGEAADTWEKQLAKKYYDKLFKEYCICDLSRYKENKVAMRWRTESELVEGKGQFSCGARKCANTDGLKTWEVNFGYLEDGVKKNALVKSRLCPECSVKLNYGHKRKEVQKEKRKEKRHSHKKKKRRSRSRSDSRDRSRSPRPGSSRNAEEVEVPEKEDASKSAENIWKEPLVVPELKSREEEFEEYLDDLFL